MWARRTCVSLPYPIRPPDTRQQVPVCRQPPAIARQQPEEVETRLGADGPPRRRARAGGRPGRRSAPRSGSTTDRAPGRSGARWPGAGPSLRAARTAWLRSHRRSTLFAEGWSVRLRSQPTLSRSRSWSRPDSGSTARRAEMLPIQLCDSGRGALLATPVALQPSCDPRSVPCRVRRDAAGRHPGARRAR